MGAFHGWAVASGTRPVARGKRATQTGSRRALMLVVDAKRDVGRELAATGRASRRRVGR